jgi:hypothetical protein
MMRLEVKERSSVSLPSEDRVKDSCLGKKRRTLHTDLSFPASGTGK